jgi:hypothetical protein
MSRMTWLLLGAAVLLIVTLGGVYYGVEVYQQKQVEEVAKAKAEAERQERLEKLSERAPTQTQMPTIDPPPEPGELDAKPCQVDALLADRGQAGAEQVVGDWVLESMSADDPNATLMDVINGIGEAQSFEKYLEDRGYVC